MPAQQSSKPIPVLAWINGCILPANSAALPVSDQAYLTGMGAFETIRTEARVPLFLDEHLQRLAESAACFGLQCPRADVLRGGIAELLARQGLENARLRVIVSGTITPDGTPFHFGGSTRTTLIAYTLKEPSPCRLRIVSAPFRMYSESPLAGHKCTSYALYALAMRYARDAGCDDALMLDQRGNLMGCATANFFWVNDGVVHTPDIRCGCRRGVTRERVIRACDRLKIPCRNTRSKIDAMVHADEIFITSSIRGAMSVANVDGRPYAHGEITTRLSAELEAESYRQRG